MIRAAEWWRWDDTCIFLKFSYLCPKHLQTDILILTHAEYDKIEDIKNI